MKRLIALCLIGLLLISCSPGYTAHQAITSQPLSEDQYRELLRSSPPADETIQAIQSFARHSSSALLSGESNDNYSPISLYLALSMVATGADGETARQIYGTLDKPVDPDALASDMSQLIELLNIKTDQSRIQLSNSIWNQQDIPFLDGYIKRLNEQFQASLFEVDFIQPATLKHMQDWVAKQTNDLIKPEFDRLDDAISVLINTLYYKDSWLRTFEEYATEPDIFHGVNGDVTKDFMHRDDYMSYIKQGDIEGVSLYTKTGRVVFLKQSGVNPKEILQSEDLYQLINNFESREVRLALPKFSFENHYDLKTMLKELGIIDAFDRDLADLSATSELPLYISQIFQDSFIELNEDGIEAAAATVVVEAPTSAPPADEPIELRFDEPFVYLIEDQSGLPLFIGTLSQ